MWRLRNDSLSQLHGVHPIPSTRQDDVLACLDHKEARRSGHSGSDATLQAAHVVFDAEVRQQEVVFERDVSSDEST